MASEPLLEEWRGVSVIDRFRAKFVQGGHEECWTWTGPKFRKGYGRFYIWGRTRLATHVAVYLKTGEWPGPGLLVCHTCDNPPCVNPAHLWVGTNRENMIDMGRKGRHRTRGETVGCSKLKEADVRTILASQEGQRKLARRFGVERTTIRAIKRRETWRHILPPPPDKVDPGIPMYRMRKD